MKKVTISFFQLFSMLVLFVVGSAQVIGIGLEAKQDAWIVPAVSLTLGVLLLYLYLYLYKLSGYEHLLRILEKGFGLYIGKFIGLLYSFYFLYLGTRVTKDFAYFISKTLFDNANDMVFSLTILLLVGYGLYLGIEAVARSAEILFFFLVVSVVVITLLSLMSPEFRLENFRPLLANGWGPIWKEVFPTHLTYPQGGVIAFMMIFPLVQNRDSLRKKGWLAILVSGFLFILGNLVVIGLLTGEMSRLYMFPYVKAIEMINLLKFIQHIEFIAVIGFFITVYMKIFVFTYSAVRGISLVFHMKNIKVLIAAACGVMYILTFFIASSFPSHIKIGLEWVPKYLHIPFQIIIPLLILVILLIKQYVCSKQGKKEGLS
jgi:spore germination protein KB